MGKLLYVVRPTNHKERVALKYGETFLNMFGLSLQDIRDFKETLDENAKLREENTKIMKKIAVYKGEVNEEAVGDVEDYTAGSGFTREEIN